MIGQTVQDVNETDTATTATFQYVPVGVAWSGSGYHRDGDAPRDPDGSRAVNRDEPVVTRPVVTRIWWRRWGNARADNVRWRIDYVFASPSAQRRVEDAFIHSEVLGSDH